MEWRSQALDGRMHGDHGLGHAITCGIGVEAAVDARALAEQRGKPCRAGSGTICGDAHAAGMYGRATDGINGRFAEDDFPDMQRADSEVAEVLA